VDGHLPPIHRANAHYIFARAEKGVWENAEDHGMEETSQKPLGGGFNWNRAFEEMIYNLQGRGHIGMLTERFLEMGFM
jgi:hypothetical protein